MCMYVCMYVCRECKYRPSLNSSPMARVCMYAYVMCMYISVCIYTVGMYICMYLRLKSGWSYQKKSDFGQTEISVGHF